MLCPNCEFDNPFGTRFCINCGISQKFSGETCPHCQSINPPVSKYCGHCGHVLEATADATDEIASDLTEERKLATIFFADVHGFTAISEKLDPEQVKNIMNLCFAIMTEKIVKYGGTVDKYLGDGIMAIFGAPAAHEDDEERAICAAVEIQEALAEFSEQMKETINQPLQVRIGLNTGKVMAGRLGGENNKSYTVMGDTVNLASRLEHAAEIGKILISDETYTGSGAVVKVLTPPPLNIRGKSKPVIVHQIRGRLYDAHLNIDTDTFQNTFINRKEILHEINTTAQKVTQTVKPHLILLMGNAKVGKTRVLYEHLIQTRERYPQACFFYGKALSYRSQEPFCLISDLIRSFFEVGFEDAIPEQQHQLLYGIAEYVWKHHHLQLNQISFPMTLPKTGADLSELSKPQRESLTITYYLTAMMGIPFADNPLVTTSYHQVLVNASSKANPKTDKGPLGEIYRNILKSLSDLFNYIATSQTEPVYIIINRAELVDEESLQAVYHLLQQCQSCRLIIILLSRTTLDQFAEWRTNTLAVSAIHVDSFSDNFAQTYLHELLDVEQGLPVHFVEYILDKTRGNPGFIKILVQHYRENKVLVWDNNEEKWTFDPHIAENLEMPNTVVRIVQAELDVLSQAEKQYLQKAAVIGQNFWLDLLNKLDNRRKNLFTERLLNKLLSRHFINEQPESSIPGQREFRFVLPLYHQVILETIPMSEREELHKRVVEWLSDKTRDTQRDFFPMLAFHHKSAKNYLAAFNDFVAAGKSAFDQEKYVTALLYFRQSLDILMLYDHKDDVRLAMVYEHLGDIYGADNQYDQVVKYYQQALEHSFVLEMDEPDPETLARLYRYADLNRKLANIYQIFGDFGKAQKFIATALEALGDDDISAAKTRIYHLLATIYHKLGNFDKAQQMATGALNIAHQVDDQSLICESCDTLGTIFITKGDYSQATKHLNFAYKNRTQRNDSIGLAHSVMNLGLASVAQLNFQKGIQYLEKSIAFFHNLERPQEHAQALNHLGQVNLHLADYDRAQSCFEQALAIMQDRNNYATKPSYHYHMGYTTFFRGELEDSFHHFETALKHAERLNDITLIIKIYIGIGMSSSELKYISRSLNIIEIAIDMARQINLDPIYARVLLQQAESHIALNYYQSALNSCLRAREIIASIYPTAPRLIHANSLRILADIYAVSKNNAERSKAPACYQESLQILDQIQQPFFLGRTCAHYAKLLQQTGNSDEARQYMEQARTIFKQIKAKNELFQLPRIK